MALREEFEKSGNWFFRWRSYLPLIIFPLLIIALWESSKPGEKINDYWVGLCLVISLFGLIIRCLVVGYTPGGTSGRNVEKQIANTLNTTGLYSLLRHPLYLGNFLIFLGIIIFTQMGWFILFSVLAYWLYYERIMFIEEEFLRNNFGEVFLKWAENTPAIIPRFKNWQPVHLTFSIKNVLRREFYAYMAIIAAFTFMELIKNYFSGGKLELNLTWLVIFSVSFLVFLVLRTLKRKTKVLKEKGR